MTKISNPGGLPRGLGSMQMRHSKWWLLFRDERGCLVQTNSGTANADEARHLLALRAIRTLEARLAELREIVRETGAQGGRSLHADKGRPRTIRVRNIAPAVRGEGTTRKAARTKQAGHRTRPETGDRSVQPNSAVGAKRNRAKGARG